MALPPLLHNRGIDVLICRVEGDIIIRVVSYKRFLLYMVRQFQKAYQPHLQRIRKGMKTKRAIDLIILSMGPSTSSSCSFQYLSAWYSLLLQWTLSMPFNLRTDLSVCKWTRLKYQSVVTFGYNSACLVSSLRFIADLRRTRKTRDWMRSTIP